jgi:hypothetical protein
LAFTSEKSPEFLGSSVLKLVFFPWKGLKRKLCVVPSGITLFLIQKNFIIKKMCKKKRPKNELKTKI